MSREVASRMTGTFFEKGQTAFVVQILAASAALVLFAVPHPALRASLATAFVSALAGLWICRRCRTTSSPARLARAAFLTATLALGLAWAAAAVAGLDGTGPVHDAILILIGGLIPLAAVTLDASLLAFLLFTVPICETLMGVLLSDQEGGLPVACVVGVVFGVSFGVVLTRHHSRRGHARDWLEIERSHRQMIEANAELEEARRRADETAAAKQDYAATLSHEVRTPMTGILSITNLLLESGPTQEQAQYLRMLKSSEETLLNLINDILDYSKLEAGKLELVPIDFEVCSLLDSLMDQFAEPAARRSLEFACLIDSEVPRRLRGDPGRLRQVLMNLAANALKFTDDGQVIVRVSLEEGAGEGQSGLAESRTVVRFSVRDTGMGIPEQLHETIFEPYSQVRAAAVEGSFRPTDGTGLGLSIVRQIAELMNGRVVLQSEPGKGSIFSLVVPLQIARTKASEVNAPPPLAGLRALVVDNDENDRKVFEQLLDWWGCRVDGVASAEEGLSILHGAACEGVPYQVVLMGMQLRGMDGFAAAREIRKDPLLRVAKVVIVAGFGMRGDAERAREAGCVGFLTKPVRASHLQRVVEGALFVAPGDGEGQLVTRYSAPRPPTRRARILVAEDDALSARVVDLLLRNRGHEVVAASTGRQALRELSETSFDMILMDIEMPEMNGLDATKTLRADPRHRQVPIIALTGHIEASDRQRFLAAGMNDHLGKPFQPAELDEMLAKYLAPAGSEPRFAPYVDAHIDPPPIDMEAALDRHLGNEGLLRSGFELFMTSGREQLVEIQASIEAADGRRLEVCAHALKGSAGMIGADQLAEAARRLEEIARKGMTTDCRSELARLQDEATRVFSFINSPAMSR